MKSYEILELWCLMILMIVVNFNQLLLFFIGTISRCKLMASIMEYVSHNHIHGFLRSISECYTTPP